MFLVIEDGEEWENLINTCYLLQSIVARFEKGTVISGEEKIGPVQTSLI